MELYVWGAVVLVLLLVLVWAYRSCKLNDYLPVSMARTTDCPPAADTAGASGADKKQGFVGAYGNNAAMGSCHEWDKSGNLSTFNRCTYM